MDGGELFFSFQRGRFSMQGGFWKWTACLLATAALAAGSTTAWGQQGLYPGLDPAYARQASANQWVSNNSVYAGLDSRLTALEARLADEEEKKKEEEKKGPPELEWEDTSGAKFKNKWGGRIMLDGVMWADQNAPSLIGYDDQQNYVEFRRIRLFAEGDGYGVFTYKVQLEFEPEGDGSLLGDSVADGNLGILEPYVSLKDVYLGANELPFFGTVLIGNQKEAFSLEELTSSKYITFMERALPNAAFVPARRTGIASYNYTEDERWTLAYGAFFNEPWIALRKEIVDDRQGIDIPIRVTWCPIYEADGRGVLHLGAGYLYRDDRNNALRLNARPEIHENHKGHQEFISSSSYWLDTGTMAVDDWHTMNLEAAVVYGPLSFQTELFYANTNNIGNADQDFYGAYAYGSWFLTGENRVYRRTRGSFYRVKPNTNFWFVRTVDGTDFGWGAWELAARWSYLQLDPTFRSDNEQGILHDFTLGVNWYWNPHMRMMFNYIHPWSSIRGSNDVLVDRTCEGDILAMRFQVDF
jgi:phosphate-selective porin OprO/OprP